MTKASNDAYDLPLWGKLLAIPAAIAVLVASNWTLVMSQDWDLFITQLLGG